MVYQVQNKQEIFDTLLILRFYKQIIFTNLFRTRSINPFIKNIKFEVLLKIRWTWSNWFIGYLNKDAIDKMAGKQINKVKRKYGQ